jgi:hypothetical protein
MIYSAIIISYIGLIQKKCTTLESFRRCHLFLQCQGRQTSSSQVQTLTWQDSWTKFGLNENIINQNKWSKKKEFSNGDVLDMRSAEKTHLVNSTRATNQLRPEMSFLERHSLRDKLVKLRRRKTFEEIKFDSN